MANMELVRDDFVSFKDNVDGWIKSFSIKVDKMGNLPILVDENINNINHNYELLNEVRMQVEDLKEEIRTIKLMQVFIMQNTLDKKIMKEKDLL